jgi:hypothetical protein
MLLQLSVKMRVVTLSAAATTTTTVFSAEQQQQQQCFMQNSSSSSSSSSNLPINQTSACNKSSQVLLLFLFCI